MAAASASTVWNVERGAGAQEPGAAGVTVVQNDETVLRVAFYNVGIQQSDLNTKKGHLHNDAAKIWRMTSLKDSVSIAWISFACASWENTRSDFRAERTWTVRTRKTSFT